MSYSSTGRSTSLCQVTGWHSISVLGDAHQAWKWSDRPSKLLRFGSIPKRIYRGYSDRGGPRTVGGNGWFLFEIFIGARAMEEKVDYTYEDISKMIDHSLLAPTLTDGELESGCRLAVLYNVATVCIKPYFVRQCAELLAPSDVKPSTTVGFPHGGHTTRIKVAEAEAAIEDGAEELDMVVNIGKVLSEDWAFVEADIRAVLEVVREHGKVLKVIFENCYLQDAHKIRLCEICGELGVDFVKTSTGYGEGGATVEDIRLMRQHCPPHVQIKAAGGIRTLDKLLEMRALGVTRVGATRTVDILEECRRRINQAKRAE